MVILIELDAEERRESPMPSQKEKIEETNETDIPLSNKKKKKKGRRKKKGRKKKKQKWLKHYSSGHRILLVGEGDFSFSLSLARAFGSASNLVATSFEVYDVVIKKYRDAKTNLENLVKLGATVLVGVDATKMKLYMDLSKRQFDRIIFNFPHAGFHGKECDSRMIRLHRYLLKGFFQNASQMLYPCGEIHVSHKTGAPYDRWNLEELASKCSLTLMECVDFKREDYPGYTNKKGDGPRCDEPFYLGACSTFKFRVNTKKTRNDQKQK